MKSIIHKFFTSCGIIGPIFFTFILLILGHLQGNYNHIEQYMSELGAIDAPNTIIMNIAGFALLGLFIILFAIGFNNLINLKNNLIIGKIGIMLIISSGVAFIMVGIFPCDPMCVNISLVGIIHGRFAFIALYTLVFAPFFIFYYLREVQQWKNLSIFSLIIGVLSLLSSSIYNLNIFENLTGLLQRLSYGIPLLWIVLISIRIISINNSMNVNK